MKRAAAIIFCMMTIAIGTFSVSAAGLDANKQEIMDAVKTTITVDGKTVSLPISIVNQAENYLRRDDVTFTDAQTQTILGYIEDSVKIVKDAKVTSMAKLNASQVASIVDLVRKAGEEAGLNVVFNAAKNEVTIHKDGQLIATMEPVLKVTGADTRALLVVTGAGIALLAGCLVVARRKRLFSK